MRVIVASRRNFIMESEGLLILLEDAQVFLEVTTRERGNRGQKYNYVLSRQSLGV
jgi:hypothetical protein